MPNSPDCVLRLVQIGISINDAHDLRRIAMTLHRWHEAECNGYIQRDEITDKPWWHYNNGLRSIPAPDREKGALKRLAKIMARYPTLGHYVQGDPRGASLYILPAGETEYTRGIAVYK